MNISTTTTLNECVPNHTHVGIPSRTIGLLSNITILAGERLNEQGIK